MTLPSDDRGAHLSVVPDESATPDAGDRVRAAFDRYHELVYVTALRLLNHPEDAADVTQSIFAMLCEKGADIQSPERTAGFLKTATVRRCLEVLRRRRWWRRPRGRQASAAVAQRGPTLAPPDLHLAVEQLLDRLRPLDRAVVMLKLVEQHSYDEIAEQLEVSVPTVRRRLASARARLAKLASGETQCALVAQMDGDT